MIRLKKTYTKAELEHPTEKMWKQFIDLADILDYDEEYIFGGDETKEEMKARWTARDFVSEIDYYLGTYFENGHANCDMRDDGEKWRKEWYRKVGFARRYLKHMVPITAGTPVSTEHSSQYDDCKISEFEDYAL